MTEKSYYAHLTRYYVSYGLKMNRSISWEAKFSRTHRISFIALQAHQEEYLLQSERAIGWKFPDVGRMKKLFDGAVICNALSYFIAIYFLPHGKTEIYQIPIRSFVQEKYKSNEKSLTKKRAAELGKLIKI